MSLFPLITFHLTVAAHQCAVEFVDGRQTRVLMAGRHNRPRRATYQWVDLREQLHLVNGQEVLTTDGVQVRITAAVRYRVVEPVSWLARAADPLALLHLRVQLVLREQVAQREFAELVGRHLDGRALVEAVAEVGHELGVEVLEVTVKDVIVPSVVRDAALELATARQRGAAQLELAQAETATLRSLANAAKLLDEHPALARLRLVQSVPAGSTVRLEVE